MSRNSLKTLRFALLLIVVGALLIVRNRHNGEQELPHTSSPPAATEESDAAKPEPHVDDRERTEPGTSKVEVGPVAIRNLQGKVVYRGMVDLAATLERIEAGERLRFRNDGSVFENREQRLPTKPRGYYREYVHPTPGLDGPGPQRLVIGSGKEIYYTSDHYRSFKQIEGRHLRAPPESDPRQGSHQWSER